MAYQALYRQWRPKDFSSMVGQEAVVSTLRNQVISGRIAHAYLFCGSRGTGKTSTSKIFARAINCQNPKNGDPCGECESCKRLLNDESMDLMEFDAASNSRVENMRELLEPVNYPPQHGKYKVYIIDEVHMLSTSAFNALLKTLEEPPAHVVFILATTEPQKIPATILSRCQRYDFGRIPADKIAGRLKEAVAGANAQADDQALMMIARAAEGGMRDALSILDMCLGYDENVTEQLVTTVLGSTGKKFLFQFADAVCECNPALVLSLIDDLMRDGKDPQVFAKEMSEHIRALLMAKYCSGEMTELMDITLEDAEEYGRQATKFTETRLLQILDLFMSVETNLRYASSPRIALETASLKACIKTKETDQQAIQDRITELEQEVEKLTSQISSGVFTAAAANPVVTTAKPVHPDNLKKKEAVVKADASDIEIWNAMISSLNKTDPGDVAMLKAGNFAGRNGNVFQWTPANGENFYVMALNKEQKRDSISKALSDVSGKECTFQAVLPTQKDEIASNSTLDDLIAAFPPGSVSQK